MEILSSFIHPQVVPNLYEFLSSAEHKRRYFEECQYNQQFMGLIDFHSIFFSILWQSMGTINCVVTYIPQNIFIFFDELGFYNIKPQIKPSRSCHTQKSPVGCSVNLSTAGQFGIVAFVKQNVYIVTF